MRQVQEGQDPSDTANIMSRALRYISQYQDKQLNRGLPAMLDVVASD